MKQLSAVFVVACMLFFTSCDKDSSMIDQICGAYTLTGSEYVVWGSDSGTLNVNKSFAIIHYRDGFKMTGAYSATGRISDGMIVFDSYTVSDSGGYMTIAIQPTVLVGNTMNISVVSSGKLAYNGVLYPYSSRVNAVATKYN